MRAVAPHNNAETPSLLLHSNRKDSLSKAEIDELEKRELAYISGEGKSYSWEEVKSKIRVK